MKRARQHVKFAGMVMLFGGLMISCRKNEPAPGDPGKPGTSGKADTISNHFQFFNASKKQGIIPKGPAGSTLKISFKDTLYLADEIKRPIKFLHDETKNVAGVYLQVHFIASASSFYYDVPEVPETADSDTVSVIMIGIDPVGLETPQTFDLTITPYDETGQPLDEATKPVKIDKPNKDPHGSSCGLVLPSGEKWDWILSYIQGNNTYTLFNQPGKVFSGKGQDIEGSCCSGHSRWPEFCAGQKQHNNKLHFATYYRINFENFMFFNNGTFFRQTMEDSPVPVPDESDFCTVGGTGKVIQSLKHTRYDGNWTIVPAKLPPNPPAWLKGDSLSLIMMGTSSTGFGYGNPGGVIHDVDCKTGLLVLVQLDNEGGGRHLMKFYTRVKPGDPPNWF